MKRALNSLLTNSTNILEVVQFCKSHFGSIAGTFLNCSNEEINSVFTKFLIKVFKRNETLEGFDFLDSIFELLTTAMSTSYSNHK
jgi:hypothetical protein